MEKIKLTFVTKDEGSGKQEKMTCTCFDGRAMIQFSNPMQGEVTFKRMKEDGKKVLFSRGVLIQMFPGKTYKEICKIMEQDAINGVKFTNETTERKVVIVENTKEVYNA